MQRLTFIILFFISLNAANAQIRKGQWLTGGNGDFSHASQSNNQASGNFDLHTSMLDLSADGGYFLLDQLCAGIRGGINYVSVKQTQTSIDINSYYRSNSTQRNSTWLAGPFVRYYFLKPGLKFNVFADLNYDFGYSSAKNTTYYAYTDPANGSLQQVSSSTAEVKTPTGSFVAEAGPVWFINSKTSLELTAGYMLTRYTRQHDQSDAFIIGLGFHIHLYK